MSTPAKQVSQGVFAQIERVFDDYLDWLENTQLTEDQPYLQVATVFTGAPVSA